MIKVLTNGKSIIMKCQARSEKDEGGVVCILKRRRLYFESSIESCVIEKERAVVQTAVEFK